MVWRLSWTSALGPTLTFHARRHFQCVSKSLTREIKARHPISGNELKGYSNLTNEDKDKADLMFGWGTEAVPPNEVAEPDAMDGDPPFTIVQPTGVLDRDGGMGVNRDEEENSELDEPTGELLVVTFRYCTLGLLREACFG